MKNQTSSKLVLDCGWALACMQHQGIVPKHQLLDNQASAAYIAAIKSNMTYQPHKTILEGLDGLFSHVAAMIIGGNKLVCHVGLLNGCNVRP
jgi:hypothetical protein